MDLTTMKSRLVWEGEIRQMNGPGFNDMKIVAGILLDIRDLLFEINSRETIVTGEEVKINPASADLTPKKDKK